MASIGIAYSGSGGSYNVILNEFTTQELPRSYSNDAEYQQGISGATLLAGPAFKQKYVWAISARVDRTTAENLDGLFNSWDQDRADGLPAACGVVDQTFGSSVSVNAIFSTAPQFEYLNQHHFIVSFGLTEV